MQLWLCVLAVAAVAARPERRMDSQAGLLQDQPVTVEESKPEAAVPEDPAGNEKKDSMQALPVPIEPDVMQPDDSKVFPEGSLRTTEKEGPRTGRSYVSADGIERRARQLTDIHVLFLKHPEQAARLSARLSAGEGALHSGTATASATAAKRTSRSVDDEWDLARPRQDTRSLDLPMDPRRDAAFPRTGVESSHQPTRRQGSVFPTLMAVTAVIGPVSGSPRSVLQDPLQREHDVRIAGHTAEGGMSMDGRPRNYSRMRQARGVGSHTETAGDIIHDEDSTAPTKNVTATATVDDSRSNVTGTIGVDDEVGTQASEDNLAEAVNESVENGEHGPPSEAEAYREDEEIGPSDVSPQDAVEKQLRKTKNKVDKRVTKVVTQVGGLAKRVQARVGQVLLESSVHGDAGRADSAAPGAAPNMVVVLHRGGVAVAGPGGVATAAFGGTAIVGPGGIAYTAPDSTAVAGPGARVVAVPSQRLLDMFKAFRTASERGVADYRPAWLGSIPDDGRLVAVGPVVYRHPPDGTDRAVGLLQHPSGGTLIADASQLLAYAKNVFSRNSQVCKKQKSDPLISFVSTSKSLADNSNVRQAVNSP